MLLVYIFWGLYRLTSRLPRGFCLGSLCSHSSLAPATLYICKLTALLLSSGLVTGYSTTLHSRTCATPSEPRFVFATCRNVLILARGTSLYHYTAWWTEPMPALVRAKGAPQPETLNRYLTCIPSACAWSRMRSTLNVGYSPCSN